MPCQHHFLSMGKEDVPGELEKFPLLVEHYKRVLNVPEIIEWVKKRTVTEFLACGCYCSNC